MLILLYYRWIILYHTCLIQALPGFNKMNAFFELSFYCSITSTFCFLASIVIIITSAILFFRYLNWVIPELPVPPHDSAYYGEVQCKATGHCWRVRDDDLLEIATNCFEHKIIPQNTFSLSRDGRLTYRDLCVTFMFPKPFLKVQRCSEPYDPDEGQWKVKYSAKEHYWGRITVSMRIKGEINTWCIGQVRSALDPYKGHMMPQTFSCDDKSDFIIWKFTHQFDSLRH